MPAIEISQVLSAFPKERPALSGRYAQLYVSEYRRNRERAGVVEKLARQAESWMHRRVAAHSGGGATLELGAGTLNHLQYEDPGVAYDIVEPFVELFSANPLQQRIRRIYSRLAEIPLEPTYSRIISIAVLEHMTELPYELARSALLLETGGVFQAGIPSEGGALWWLGWRCTTGLGYWLRNHLDYGVVMRHEHVNSANEIIALLRHLFAEMRVVRFPLPGQHFSLYAYIEARSPNRQICRQLLSQSPETRR